MAGRGAHSSSRLPSPEPEPCSLDCFRQHAHLDKQCMQCSHGGRQASRKEHTHAQTESESSGLRADSTHFWSTADILPEWLPFVSLIVF